jgi:type III restriction enzyme
VRQVIIENPILNSPFAEPERHFRFTEEGITNEVVEKRRVSSYFVPIAQPKKKGKQLTFETQWTQDRVRENNFINLIRIRVGMWRQGGYVDVTSTTRRLLEYWTDSKRERKLFFCQIEALETLIYITEVAHKYGDTFIDDDLRTDAANVQSNLYRMAFKMATGSGKTVVMAMMIAWHSLNKLANPKDSRFTDSFLLVAPGITIRDRLRVLLPNDPQNYYRERDIVSADLLQHLCRSKIVITNYHAFGLRERGDASRLTKSLLTKDTPGAFTETPDQMVHRVCREFGNSKRQIMVINDEAHHCFHARPKSHEEKLTGDDRKEAEQNAMAARVWISGLEAIRNKIGIKAVYDLSATPFYLKGSGYPEGTLFPWVVSDFSLIDAIESGIVKIPRVPVSDDSGTGETPTYRDLWMRIREQLPKKGRGTEAVGGEPNLPAELQGALESLYGNYDKSYRLWDADSDAQDRGVTPPVLIVVCNNTNVSKLVYDYVAGWEKKLADGSYLPVPGRLPIFSNVSDGRWAPRPNTLLIDSEQLESGEAMRDDFKAIAAREIEEFKEEYRARFPGRDADQLTDEDILREVMNTVGKAGKLGENIRCVISVSMLTEGWDANTVTHVLGIRAFGTQLLCEQVVGRALRRMSYVTNQEGKFAPEYAEVYGVPFSFIPSSGTNPNTTVPSKHTRIKALPDRIACEITFPRLVGYRYELPSERLDAVFTDDAKLALSTADVPTKVQLDPIVGESSMHTLYGLQTKRTQELAFDLARRTLEKYFRDDEGSVKHWLFPQLLAITKRWLAECVTCKDNAFPQMLLLAELGHDATDKIYRSIAASYQGEKTLQPHLRPYDTIGSTRYVDFDTSKDVYRTSPYKSHVSHVVADSWWEQKMAEVLEDMPEVIRYVKNQNLGFTIPYTLGGHEHQYIPDYLVCVDDGHGLQDLLNLILEVSGEKRKDKAAKVATVRSLWVPAVNNHGGLGRWSFIEISDPWDAANTIRAALRD